MPALAGKIKNLPNACYYEETYISFDFLCNAPESFSVRSLNCA